TPLTLPIHLDPLCIGKSCDPASTCFKGTCVDASAICRGSDCGLVEELGGEGSANEAGSSDGAYDADLDGPGFEDVFVPDGGVRTDASIVDARVEAGPVTYPPCLLSVGPSSAFYQCSPPTGGSSVPGACD